MCHAWAGALAASLPRQRRFSHPVTSCVCAWPTLAEGLVDPAFPSPSKPDVGVRSKASSLANTIASIRSGAEAVKQTSLRTGSLVTTSMMGTLSQGYVCRARGSLFDTACDAYGWGVVVYGASRPCMLLAGC